MRLFLVLVVMLMSATTASADWQFTRWGQSLEEVLDNANKGVRKTTGDEERDLSNEIVGRALAIADYNAPEVSGRAIFLFRNNKLTGVALIIKEPKVAAFALSQMMDQYGSSTYFDDRSEDGCQKTLSIWRDVTRQNIVMFSGWDCGDRRGSNFLVLYKPFLTAEETGL